MRGNVLVVEDDPELLLSLSEVLESEGYWVTCARHGLEASDDCAEGLAPP